MNQRMKDLVGQAKFMAEESINKKISANDELYAFAEKFAELIVLECAQVAYRYTDKPSNFELYSEIGWECLPGDLQDHIEKHFGVEE